MTSTQTATASLLLGMSLEQARDALATPVEGECFWLAHHCGKPTAEGDWLCPEHRAWTPELGGAPVRGNARGVWLRGEA